MNEKTAGGLFQKVIHFSKTRISNKLDNAHLSLTQIQSCRVRALVCLLHRSIVLFPVASNSRLMGRRQKTIHVIIYKISKVQALLRLKMLK